MVVTFFRLTVKGTESKLNIIKSWLDTKIVKADLADKIGGGVVVVSQDLDDNWVLSLDMFLKSSISKVKYVDIVKNQWSSLDKTGLVSASIVKYDNCSHDSVSPQPCSPTNVFVWGSS